MELTACNLRSILEKKPLNPVQILSIGLDVARGINYLHLMRPGGNPTYAAPEANSPSEQGPKMDVYSYGVLLLEMCTRKFPDPKSIDNEALLKKIQSRSQLASVVRQCLQVLPDDRPSMKDVIAQLSV